MGWSATGTTLVVDAHNLTLISAGLSSITLITGFVVFATVRRSRPFDRRLVLSGYRPSALIAAKTTAAPGLPNVGMSDQCDIVHILHSHHRLQAAVLLICPKLHPALNLL